MAPTIPASLSSSAPATGSSGSSSASSSSPPSPSPGSSSSGSSRRTPRLCCDGPMKFPVAIRSIRSVKGCEILRLPIAVVATRPFVSLSFALTLAPCTSICEPRVDAGDSKALLCCCSSMSRPATDFARVPCRSSRITSGALPGLLRVEPPRITSEVLPHMALQVSAATPSSTKPSGLFSADSCLEGVCSKLGSSCPFAFVRSS